MKYLALLLLSLLVFATGCGDDDDEDVRLLDAELNYAGPQFLAPNLGQGSHEYAAYFPGNFTSQFQGRVLEAIEFDLVAVPQSVEVIVYESGRFNDEPGSVIYRRNISSQVTGTGVQRHVVAEPIEITGNGLWLAIAVEHAGNTTQSVGCDDGSQYNVNGDRLRSERTDQRWTTFREVTNGAETVNFNIRGYLAE